MKNILWILLALFTTANCQNIAVEISPAGAPVMTALPSISGTLSVGSTLTSTTGTWTNSPVSYAYQWKRNAVDISGATSSTYLLVDADAGNKISVGVTPTNGSGAGRQAISLQSNIAWPSSSAIGAVFTDNFNRATPGSNYSVTAPDVTFSQNGTFLRSDRTTTGGFANYIQLLWPGSGKGFLGEVISMKIRFRIVTTSIGLSIGWKSISGNSVVDVTGLFRTAGASSYCIIYQNGSTVSSQSTAFNVVNGDQCELEFQRSIATMTVIGRKLDGSGNIVNSSSVAYTFNTSTGTTLAMNTSELALYFNGGVYDLETLTLTYSLNKYPNIAFVGNSITQWYFASTYPNRYAALTMIGSSKSSVVLAGQGNRTAEIIASLDELILLRPQYAVLDIGTNDIGTSVPDATWQANYQTIINTMIANGIKPIILYITPRNGYDFRPTVVGSPNKWIVDTYGSDSRVVLIDTYTPLKDPGGNGIYSIYSTDGLHPNNSGMQLLAKTIRDAIQSIIGI